MKVLFALLGFLLLEVCLGMGDGEYCFSCDAGANDGSDNRCNDQYIPPPSIHISPNICDDISKNVTEESRLCKRYPKGYIFRCYTDYDGNFFNCKSSCTVPLEDVGKSIGIQDNLSKVMNHGLLAGFGSDNDKHPDLLSNLGLDMFNYGANNVHAAAAGKGSHPSNQAGKPPTPPGYAAASQPEGPNGAFNVDKPLMFQQGFPQYNFQQYRGQQYPNSGQAYGNPNQYGNNRGYANPYAPPIQGQQGQYPPNQGNGYQQNPVYSQQYQGQYPSQNQGYPQAPPPHPSLPNVPSHPAPVPNSYNYAPPAPSNRGSYVQPTSTYAQQNHANVQPSYPVPPPPPSNVPSNQATVPHSYNYAPQAPSNPGPIVPPPPPPPTDVHQNNVNVQPSYPATQTNVHGNLGPVPSSYVPVQTHQQYNFPSENQGNTQESNQYNVNDNVNDGFGGEHGSSSSNFGGNDKSRDTAYSQGGQGTVSKSGSNDQTAFNNAAERFGHNNFGMNGNEFGKQNGNEFGKHNGNEFGKQNAFLGFDHFGDGQHGNQGFQTSAYGKQSKVFDLLNSNMAKQKALLNKKKSTEKSDSGASNIGQHSANSNGNTYSSSSSSSSNNGGQGSFGVFGKTDKKTGKTVGSHGVNTNLYGNQGHNQLFDNFGQFFRQPARKSGATQQKDNRVNFNFGNMDDFMNEEFRHRQGELQPMFSGQMFTHQGYQKLFPDYRGHQASSNGGLGKTKQQSMLNNVGTPHTEQGRFFDFVGMR